MNLKNSSKEHGFTIVELLVVIVVIGILAVITIVSYSSVQNRARAATNQANAQEVQNKAEVYASDTGNGLYPGSAAAFIAVNSPDSAALSPKIDALIQATAPAAGANAEKIYYAPCGTSPNFTGAKIGYWDSSLPTPAVVYVNAGSATGVTSAC